MTNSNTAKVRWHCNRGMLELDLMLLPFFDNYFAKLSKSLQEQFIQLLTYSDPELSTALLDKTQRLGEEVDDILKYYHAQCNITM